MRSLLTKTMLLISLMLSFAALGYGSVALADGPFSDVCSNASASSSAVCSDTNSSDSNVNGSVNPIYHTIHVAANIIALLGGIVGVITIMIGGFNYITSSGEQEKIKNAKTRIFGAVIGLVILALAYTITTFGVNLIK